MRRSSELCSPRRDERLTRGATLSLRVGPTLCALSGRACADRAQPVKCRWRSSGRGRGPPKSDGQDVGLAQFPKTGYDLLGEGGQEALLVVTRAVEYQVGEAHVDI